MMKTELTPKQIKSKILTTEKKIHECEVYISNRQKEIHKFKENIKSLEEKGGYYVFKGTKDESWLDYSNDSDSIKKHIEDNKNNIKYWEKVIRDFEKKINKYDAQLSEYKKLMKGEEKNYPIIREFLNNWADNYKCEILDNISNYLDALKTSKKQIKDAKEEYMKNHPNAKSWDFYYTEEKMKKEFHREWSWIIPFVDNKGDFKSYDFEYMMEKEKESRYCKFVEEVEFYVGEILDISNLSLNYTILNGFVTGNKGKVSVDTIVAGGYNIQCKHLRTLIKKIM